MTYRIRTIGDFYYILEVPTQRLLCKSHDEQYIKDMCKRLNAGGGFDGHTPAFFLVPSL